LLQLTRRTRRCCRCGPAPEGRAGSDDQIPCTTIGSTTRGVPWLGRPQALLRAAHLAGDAGITAGSRTDRSGWRWPEGASTRLPVGEDPPDQSRVEYRAVHAGPPDHDSAIQAGAGRVVRRRVGPARCSSCSKPTPSGMRTARSTGRARRAEKAELIRKRPNGRGDAGRLQLATRAQRDDSGTGRKPGDRTARRSGAATWQGWLSAAAGTLRAHGPTSSRTTAGTTGGPGARGGRG